MLAVCVLLLREVMDFESVLWVTPSAAEVKVVSAAAVVPVPALEAFILSWLLLYVFSWAYIAIVIMQSTTSMNLECKCRKLSRPVGKLKVLFGLR